MSCVQLEVVFIVGVTHQVCRAEHLNGLVDEICYAYLVYLDFSARVVMYGVHRNRKDGQVAGAVLMPASDAWTQARRLDSLEIRKGRRPSGTKKKKRWTTQVQNSLKKV